MWKRCWWATWVSGFFGIAGVLHLVRAFIGVRLVIGQTEIPTKVSAMAGVVLLLISAGLLGLEAYRERHRHLS